MFSTIDLHRVLVQVQDPTPVPTSINSFTKSNQNYNQFDFDQLETNRIFHRDAIKKICIDYRLRFLNLSYFKSDVPVEAIERIKALEKWFMMKFLINLKINYKMEIGKRSNLLKQL